MGSPLDDTGPGACPQQARRLDRRIRILVLVDLEPLGSTTSMPPNLGFSCGCRPARVKSKAALETVVQPVVPLAPTFAWVALRGVTNVGARNTRPQPRLRPAWAGGRSRSPAVP